MHFFLLGTRGGEAIADVIFGDYNPNGKMPISFPKNPNGITTYDIKPLENYDSNTLDHLYTFGHGLSYTQFVYDSLELSSNKFISTKSLKVSINVKNVGKLDGKETVIMFLNDEYGSLTRPIKQMKRFQKIDLKSGEVKKVEFELNKEDLSFIDNNGKRIVEPGAFNIYVGNLSTTFILEL